MMICEHVPYCCIPKSEREPTAAGLMREIEAVEEVSKVRVAQQIQT